MSILLDTQAFLWFLSDDPRLGRAAHGQIVDPKVHILLSVVSLWEAAIKIRAGQVIGSLPAMIEETAVNGFRLLAVEPSHLRRLMSLPVWPRHRDPFDHLLLAQAAAEGVPLMTSDRALGAYGTALMDAAA